MIKLYILIITVLTPVMQTRRVMQVYEAKDRAWSNMSTSTSSYRSPTIKRAEICISISSITSTWFKATQGLMSVGLGLGLIALLVATLSLCCTCHSCNPHHPVCGLLLTSCISMAVGIVIFGVKAHDDWKIEFEKGLYGSFGWSFWVGIGATAMAFLTSCIYCCMGRKRH